MDTRQLSIEQHAALFAAVRRQAHAFRRQAIADLWARAAAAFARLAGRRHDDTGGTPCRS